MKAILKCPWQDLFVKVYRYELALGIIILFVSRHIAPFLTKRSLCFLRMSIWRYYHAFKTFSTASIGIGRGLTTPLLPHHRTYGSRIRRFGKVSQESDL